MSSVSEWINWSSQTMDYCSVFKEWKYQAAKRHGGTVNTLLSRRSQSENLLTVLSPAVWLNGEGRTMEMGKDQWLPEERREGQHRALLGSDAQV